MPEPTEHDLTLAGFQAYIRDKYYEQDAARGTPGTFMWLIEEIGELATNLQKIRGEGGQTSGGSTHEELEGEFADVLAWLCTLANINNVDLSEAVRKKYLREDGGPSGVK
ncbi:MazG nucleotide pyrophosphohydrolase domain-containing protein [Mucisphaera sp.]|uniref:MazG nucleotide pyrophosphohydrolase domain-containing protein n=1 Tax=Mucisphaera sp. TaxID=2913024 RepID=UPI003D0F1AA9